ncbi:MAG: glutaredoxin family protein [Chlorobiaceae bacterium]|nr:glutaredoxin family protein [Chlorobiaceae bacterium]
MDQTHHTVTIYGKKECCLCDEAMVIIQKVAATVPFMLEKKDITEDPELLERFATSIPVIFVDGRQVFKYRVIERRLRELLA